MSSPQIWNKEEEKNSPKKRQSKWQASDAQREKKRQRSRARDKKRRHFFVGITTWKFCSGGNERRNASSHQCKVKMSGSEKQWRWTHMTFPSKNMKLRSFWKFHIVVMQNNAKEMYKKNLPHVQNCFFANYTCCCFSPFSSVAFAIYHYTILYFVWTKYKYHQELRVKP